MPRNPLPADLFALAVAGAWPPSASAAVIDIIDQQNLGAEDQFPGAGISQSFTPTLAGIDAIELLVGAADTSVDMRLDLFEGDGTGGALLASTGALSLTDVFGVSHFDFASTVPLTPGDVYTFQLVQLAGDGIVTQGTGDTYAGGTAYDAGGMPAFFGDIYFVEGLHATATIPEPSSLALLATCGLAAAGVRRRRQKQIP